VLWNTIVIRKATRADIPRIVEIRAAVHDMAAKGGVKIGALKMGGNFHPRTRRATKAIARIRNRLEKTQNATTKAIYRAEARPPQGSLPFSMTDR
jgi:hypothetical protein